MDIDEEISNTALIWRSQAPPFLTDHWQGIERRDRGPEARVKAAIGLGDALLRFLVAVGRAELHALGHPPPQQLTVLEGVLDRSSIGHWHQAAHAIARALSRREDRHAAELFEPFAPLPKVGGRSPTNQAFDFLIELRNDTSHANNNRGPTEREWPELFERCKPHVRELLQAFRCVRSYPVCVTTGRRSLAGGSLVTLHRLHSHVVALEDVPGDGLLDERPFVVTPDGAALDLHPFVVWEHRRGADDRSPLLFHALRNARAIYTGGWKEGSPWALQPPHPLPALSPTTTARVHEGSASHVDHIPGWTVGDRLGIGGSGRVLRARDEAGNERALKVLNADVAQDPAHRERLRREYAILAELSHPGIASVHDLLEVPDLGPVLVMEYVAGRPLSRLGALDPDTAVAIVSKLLDALGHLHGCGIVHRDVKPANILLATDGRVRLVDFGVARDASKRGLTRTFDAVGTLSFCAPEQLRGGCCDARSDVYAAGRVLGELVAGSEGHPLPPRIAAVVRRATQTEPDQRYRDAEAMGRALAGLADAPDAPIAAGDYLTDGYGVAEAPRRLEEGLWAFRALAIASASQVGVLLATSPAAKERLGSLLPGRPLDRTRDEYAFAVLTEAELAQVERRLGSPPGSESPTPAEPDADAAPPSQQLGARKSAAPFVTASASGAAATLAAAAAALAGVGALGLAAGAAGLVGYRVSQSRGSPMGKVRHGIALARFRSALSALPGVVSVGATVDEAGVILARAGDARVVAVGAHATSHQLLAVAASAHQVARRLGAPIVAVHDGAATHWFSVGADGVMPLADAQAVERELSRRSVR